MRGYTVGGTGYMRGQGNIGGRGYMGQSGFASGTGYGYGGQSAMNSLDGYSTGGAGYGAAVDPWTQMYNEAKAANESRYQDILKGYGKRYGSAMKAISKMGRQAAKDVNQNFDELDATNQQSLTGRGLTGTTVLPTMQAGVARERSAAQARLAEQINQRQVDMKNQLSGDILQFKERRTDGYPDLQQMAQLYGAYGARGGGYGAAPVFGGGGGGLYGGMASSGYGMPNFYQQHYAYGGGGRQGGNRTSSRSRPSVNAYDLPNVGDWGANSSINQLPGTPYSPPTTMIGAMVPGRQNPRQRDFIRRRPMTYGNDMQYA